MNYEMSDRIAYNLGLFQSDGCLGVNRNRRKIKSGEERLYEYWFCHFGSTDKILVEEFRSCFGVKSEVIVSPDKRKETYKDYYRLNTHDRKLVGFLRKLTYSERKLVDVSVLKEALKGYEFAFIQGMIEGDGHVTDSDNYTPRSNYVEIVSDSEELTEWLAEVLKEFDARIYVQLRKTCKLYTVRVWGKNLVDFYQKVYSYKPSFVSRKQQRLLNIINVMA